MMLPDPRYTKDGWSNLLAGIGKTNRDKTRSTEYGDITLLDDAHLSFIYDGDGFATNIVDAVADDMTRSGWYVETDEDGLIEKEMKRLKVNQIINQALKYMRLYRGAVIIIVTEKGKLEKPLPINSGVITNLKVYSAARINIMTTDIITDPNSKYFDDVEYYNIRLRNGTNLKVHKSRCLVFKGGLTSDYTDLDFKYRYWGISIIQKIWDQLKDFGAVSQGIANLMMEVNIGKYTLSNFAQILSLNRSDALEKIMTRLDAIDLSKSMINAVLLGEGESYERDTANLSGVSDIIDRMQINLSAVSNIPVTRLFGRSPAGMNSTGESDLRNYYDRVSTQQFTKLEGELEYLIKIMFNYLYPNKNMPFEIKFNSLWEPTEREKAEINKMKSETYTNYINMGVIMPEDVQKIEFPDIEYNETAFEFENELGKEEK